MPNPQQPELRRNEKGSTTEDGNDAQAAGQPQSHGGTPPEQQSPYPS